jgi:hypothetical protein
MSSLEEQLDALRSKLDQDYALPWLPKPGDEIAGVVARVDHRRSTVTQTEYPIVTIDGGPERGVAAVHGYHAVIRDEIVDQGVSEGDLIIIRYNGTRTSQAGKQFESYDLAVEHRGRRQQDEADSSS